MICSGCVASLPFLQHYTGLAVVKVDKKEEKVEGAEGEDNEVNVENVDGGDNIETAEETESGNVCRLSKPLPDTPTTSSLFLPIGWRSALCKCSSCTQLYSDTRTTFLTQETDTVHHYESQVLLCVAYSTGLLPRFILLV